MKARKDAGGAWVVILDKEERVREAIEGWAEREGVRSASLMAIGALKDAELGFYHLERGTYHRAVYAGDHELISCDGNITMKDGKPFLHIHVALGKEDFSVVGGHCFDATVAVTMECIVRPLQDAFERQHCPAVKLATIHP